MIKFLENSIDFRLKKELLNLQSKDKENITFNKFKKNFPWLSLALEKEISGFYNKEIKKKIISQKLPKDIQKEVYLYYWVRENKIQWLIENFEEVYLKLQEFSSLFLSRIVYYFNLLKNKKTDMHLVFENLIYEWEQLLIQRIVNFKIKSINEVRDKFINEMIVRLEVMNSFNTLYASIWDFFGRFWDGDVETLKKLNLKQLEKTAKFLQQDPAILTIAKLLGRLKGESHLTEKSLVDITSYRREVQLFGNSPQEIIGITESNNLEHLLPTEIVHFSLENLRPIFYKRLMENKLNTFDFSSEEIVSVKENKKEMIEKPLPEEEGPFILCIDTSKSMQGEFEYIAKAFSLAIAKIALKQRRDCYLINFSKTLEVFDLTKVRSSLKALVTFLSRSFHSNTNVNPAVLHAINVMTYKKYCNADLLVISDFLTTDLNPNVIQKIKQLKEKRNRFHAISVGTKSNWKVIKYFDNNWIYDVNNPFTKNDIINDLEKKLKSKVEVII